MKTYSQCPASLREVVDRLLKKYHPELDKLNVYFDLLFVDGEPPALTHRGCPAFAVVRINSRKDRVKGAGDAEIVFDRAQFELQKPATQEAIIDHEIYHVIQKRDAKNAPMFHGDGRPKLKLRKHDREFGWFDEIARRHGAASIEVQQASWIIAQTGQLYFAFHADVKSVARLALPAPREGIEPKKRRPRAA
jgi:putative metallopeptidase